MQRATKRLLQAAVVVLVVFLVTPANAADSRAVKTRVAPVYPEIAKRMRISGSVTIEVTVDADGKVTAVKTIAGNRMLSAAAEEAVKKWKFESGAGESTVQVELNFNL